MDEKNKTIQFIDSEYRELFRIPDGGSIKVIFPPDDIRRFVVRECKYIDPYHFEIKGNGSDIYHICQFAEWMEKIGAKYEPLIQLQNVEIVPFVPGEEKFCTRNSEEGNTNIGHIAGNFTSSGDRFHSTWTDRDNGRNTSEFQAELHSAVYALRQSILKDYDSMTAFCQNHPEAKLPDRNDLEHYGFKLETETRQYFVLCVAENTSYDSRFVIYPYDKSASVLEQKRFAEKPSVINEIKATQKAQKEQPQTSTPEFGKKKTNPEL